jgi:hypothetical protein
VNQFVVTITTGATPELFGPFNSRNAAWTFANRVRCQRPRDETMPAVGVQRVRPGRMYSTDLYT